MATTPQQIDLWRSVSSEHQRLEFKEAKNQFDNRKLYEYCVALANEGGGHLLLGVSDKPPRPIVGTAAFNDPVAMAEPFFMASRSSRSSASAMAAALGSASMTMLARCIGHLTS
jgi:hypothetical protein